MSIPKDNDPPKKHSSGNDATKRQGVDARQIGLAVALTITASSHVVATDATNAIEATSNKKLLQAFIKEAYEKRKIDELFSLHKFDEDRRSNFLPYLSRDFVNYARDFVSYAKDFVSYAKDFVSYARDFVNYSRDFENYARDFENYKRDFNNPRESINKDNISINSKLAGEAMLPSGARVPVDLESIIEALYVRNNS